MSSAMDHSSTTVKLIVIGDSGVGKTNFLLRYCEDDFKGTYVATIGVDFKIKAVNIDGTKMKLQIWDTAGQQRFKTINQAYYKGASGIILMYSVIDSLSFQNIQTWMKQINEFSGPEVRKVLVANKIDMESERKVSKEAGRKCASRFGVEYIEVSAKSGVNVNNVFNEISKQIKLVIDLEEKTDKGSFKTSLNSLKSKSQTCNC